MKKKVLIVEDDESISNNLRVLFEFEGYDAEIASNGKIALERLKSGSALPCIILLDIMMPVMDGIQFRAHQAQDPLLAALPTIVMTADPQADETRMSVGAKAFLRKPIDIFNVLEIVRECCG